MHYCMNEFDSAQLNSTSSEFCNRCGMHTDDSNGCCHDEVKIVKLNDVHNFSQINFELKVPEAVPLLHKSLLAKFNIEKILNKDFQNHSPPLLSDQDIYLQNSVFRI